MKAEPYNRNFTDSKPAEQSTALIIGASGGIGSALYESWQNDDSVSKVIGISRLQNPDTRLVDIAHPGEQRDNVWIQSDYSEDSIEHLCNEMINDDLLVTRVCICHGVLHNESIWPEKKLEEIDTDSLLEQYRINTLLPMIWLKHLLPVIRSDTPCIISVFSARVGSITDNRLGGWYGYRASKAALNMMLKTASIELARRARNVKLLSFHPGTTDTNLSRPFLANVEHQILQPIAVAESLTRIMNQQEPDGEISYIDWENAAIEW